MQHDIQFQTLCQKAKTIVEKTAKFILRSHSNFSAKDLQVKSFNSLVTRIDRQAEKMLVAGLSKLLPDAGFYAEEEVCFKNKQKDFTWIVDPLDGTTNYIHGLPFFAVSVALEYKNEIVLGIVCDPTRDECFYAQKGAGAFLNDQAISVSTKINLADCLVATGFPYSSFENLDYYMLLLRELMQNTRGIRRCGAASLDLAYVACGRFDLFFEWGLQPWDVAAGSLIVLEAGGLVKSIFGDVDPVWNPQILASNNAVTASWQKFIDKFNPSA